MITSGTAAGLGFEFGKDLFTGQPLVAIQFRDALAFRQFGSERNHETRLLLFPVLFEAAEGSAINRRGCEAGFVLFGRLSSG